MVTAMSARDITPELSAKKKNAVCRHFGGILLTVFTSLLLALEMLLVKILFENGIDGTNSAFWEGLLIAGISVPVLVVKEKMAGNIYHIDQTSEKISPCSELWPLSDPKRRNTLASIFVRAVLCNIAAIARYISLGFLPLGDSAVVSFSAPIFVGILAHFFLREKTGFVPFLTAVLALIGVAVITKPPFLTGAVTYDLNTVIGISLAVLSLAANSFQTIVTRRIRSVDPFLQVVATGISGAIVTFSMTQVMTSGFMTPTTLTTISLILALGFMSFSSTSLFVLSLKLETAEVVSLVGTSNCIFAYLAQLVVLKETLDIYSAVGGLLIFSGIVITAFRKQLMVLPKEDKLRTYFFFLLY